MLSQGAQFSIVGLAQDDRLYTSSATHLDYRACLVVQVAISESTKLPVPNGLGVGFNIPSQEATNPHPLGHNDSSSSISPESRD